VARMSALLDESLLTKGELRKLVALRKSLGEEIAERAFLEWLRGKATPEAAEDPVAQQIAAALMEQIESGRLMIPRGGYIVRRGRGRVIVERRRED
jgi:hypothetical protein